MTASTRSPALLELLRMIKRTHRINQPELEVATPDELEVLRVTALNIDRIAERCMRGEPDAPRDGKDYEPTYAKLKRAYGQCNIRVLRRATMGELDELLEAVQLVDTLRKRYDDRRWTAD